MVLSRNQTGKYLQAAVLSSTTSAQLLYMDRMSAVVELVSVKPWMQRTVVKWFEPQ